MEKIISRLALVFCFALALLFPRLIFASVDLTAVVNTINGDGVFNFTEGDAITTTGNQPVDFSVTTQDGTGQTDVALSPYYKFVIDLTLPDGFKLTDANCVDSATSTTPAQFDNSSVISSGGIGVTLGSYDSHIVCTYDAQYSDLWSNIDYLNVAVNTQGGDGTFTYTVLTNDGSNPNPVDYQISTTDGHGSGAVQGRAFYFTIHQNAPVGWQPLSVLCEDARHRSSFQYSVSYDSSGVLITASGTYRITCTFTNQSTAKIPVLFVPGMLSTKIKDQNNNFLWVDPDRMINPLRPDSYSDSFMDPLAFSGSLLPSYNLLLGDVIGSVIYAGQTSDYTDGLINEFKNQGYVTKDGAEGQNFFTFPYDWRYGVSGVLPDGTTNAAKLKVAIDDIIQNTGATKVDVIAHSLGGLIVKKYVMDCANTSVDPKIGKLVFVGVPNLGAPLAAQALLMGYDFKIFGLNSGEIKKISLNMPLAYDLLPTPAYFSIKGDYVNNVNTFPVVSKLDYAATDALFRKTGLNKSGLSEAELLHTPAFDSFDVRSKGIDTYNIVGCKSPTLAGINYQYTDLGADGFSVWRDPITGDDTVPRESAASIATDAGKTFYALTPEHGKMPSADGIRQKIVNIVSGSSLDVGNRIFDKSQIDQNPQACELNGMLLLVLSPVDITVTDGQNNLLGIDSDGNIRRDIPGASFEIENGHKYVYLPTGDGETYTISLQGSPSLGAGSGTYTLLDEKIVDGQPAGAQIFKDQLVTASFSGNLDIVSPTPAIRVSGGATIVPTFAVDGDALQDTLAPVTTATLDGAAGQAGFYRSDVTVNLSAADSAQSGVTWAGVASISYVLDNATTTVADLTASITVSDEGSHTINYFAQDKVGNQETQKTVSFVIDKTPPTITASAKTADGKDYLANSWTKQNVTVSFVCSDTGSGMDKCPAPVTITADGVSNNVNGTVLDKAGNSASVSFGSIKIDKTAPEIQFNFDQSKKDLVFTASDNLSGPGNASDQNGVVTATDLAGDNTQLNFAEKNRAQSLHAQISGLSYNGKAVDIGGNQLSFAWFYGFTPAIPMSLTGILPLPTVPATLAKGNTLTFLLQQAKLKDGSFVVALYSGKSTLILEYKNKKLNLQTILGLRLLTFSTNKGTFAWSH